MRLIVDDKFLEYCDKLMNAAMHMTVTGLHKMTEAAADLEAAVHGFRQVLMHSKVIEEQADE